MELKLDDIFFIDNPNWKNIIIKEKHYKKYPSLIYFLFKYPECENELIKHLGKIDSIKKKEKDKFAIFLLILRIFSDNHCLDIQNKSNTYFSQTIKKEITP